MSNKTEELAQEIAKNEAIKDLNRIQAIMMLTTDGFFNPQDLALLAPKIDKTFEEIKTKINQI